MNGVFTPHLEQAKIEEIPQEANRNDTPLTWMRMFVIVKLKIQILKKQREKKKKKFSYSKVSTFN